jgi:uncharacterized protein YbjT (DUF2867 family)
MRLVVFGASGATGRHVVKLAAKAGWSVRAVVRSEPQRHALTGAEESTVGDPSTHGRTVPHVPAVTRSPGANGSSA